MKNRSEKASPSQPPNEKEANASGYLVDDCFGEKLSRFANDCENHSQGSSYDQTLYTFEEFIVETNKGFSEKSQINGETHDDSSIRDTSILSKSAESEQQKPITLTGAHLSAAESQQQNSSARNDLRYVFCPTVAKDEMNFNAHMGSAGSISSSAYGYGSSTNQQGVEELKIDVQNFSASPTECNKIKENPIEDGAAALSELAAKTRAQNLSSKKENVNYGVKEMGIIARIMCCLPFTNQSSISRGSTSTRANRYLVVSEPESSNKIPQYSWDAKMLDQNDYCFKNIQDCVRIKSPGEINGQQFVIENSRNSVLAVLDNTSSITIDDCKNCIIILGPCKGSVFIRDCERCWLLSACQQFRSRDCQSLAVHLFCATCPTIEDSNIQFSPLRMSYDYLREQIYASGISPFMNRWNEIYNFTPESGKFLLDVESNYPDIVDANVMNQFKNLLSDKTAYHNIAMGKENSTFINLSISKKFDETSEKRALLLLLLPSGSNFNKAKFYENVEDLLISRILNENFRLLKIVDIDLKSGELANIIHETNSRKKFEGKLIAIEVCGSGIQEHIESICNQHIESGNMEIEVVPQHLVEQYRKQLKRLCDIKGAI